MSAQKITSTLLLFAALLASAKSMNTTATANPTCQFTGSYSEYNRDGSIDHSSIKFNGMFFEEYDCDDCQGRHYVTPDGVIHFSWRGGVSATGTFESNCNVIELRDPKRQAPTSWSRQ